MTLTGDDLELVMTGAGTTANPNASLGGAISISHEVSATALNSIFDDISGDESTAGDTEYRILAVYNSGADVAESVKVYLPTNYSTFISIGLNEAAGVNPQTIATESTAPSSVTFSSPTTKTAALDVGNLNSLQFRALYVRRVIPAATTTPKDEASFRITIEADTEE